MQSLQSLVQLPAMSRLFVRNFAIASRRGREDPRLTYDFESATERDLGAVVDLCCTDFIRIEPHSRALGLKPENCKYLFEWIISKALHFPHSLKVVDRSSGKIVAIRTISIGHRDHSKDWEPFELDEKKLTGNIGKLAAVLNESKENFWRIIDPSVEKVLRREITFVLADHQRKGIARLLVDLNLNDQELRAQGIDGIVSEASSIANQTLLASSGYKCIYQPEYSWAKKIDDGTTGIKVFFKHFRV